MKRAWLVLLASSCAPVLPETVSMAVRLRPVTLGDEAVAFSDARFDVRVIRLRPCPQADEVLDWPGVPADVATFPALGSSDPTVARPKPWSVGFDDGIDLAARARPRVPAGPWCQLDLVVDGVLTATATLPSSNGSVTFTVDMPDLSTPFDVTFAQFEPATGSSGVVNVTVTPLVIELGTELWLSSVSDALLAGETVTLGADDADAGAIRSALVVGAAMYRDPDRSGTLDDQERDEERVTGLLALP